MKKVTVGGIITCGAPIFLCSSLFAFWKWFFKGTSMAQYNEFLQYGALGVLLIVILIVLPGFLVLIYRNNLAHANTIKDVTVSHSESVKELISVIKDRNVIQDKFMQNTIANNHELLRNQIDGLTELRISIERGNNAIEDLTKALNN